MRSESAVLEQQLEDLEKRVRMWSNATAVVAGSAAALLMAAMLFGGPSAEPESVASTAVVEAPVASAPTAAPAEPAAVSTPAAPVVAAPVETPAAKPAAVATPSVVPEEPAGTVVHTVKKGETLGHIARQYYGKSSQWKPILEANRDVLPSASKLQPGMKLKVPR